MTTHYHTLDCVGTDCHDPNAPLTREPGLREAAQTMLGAARDSGFPEEDIEMDSSYAQSITVRGRDLAALRAALASEDRT